MLDVMKASMGKEKEEPEGDDEFGMSLELSIGGSYAKADDNSKGKTEYKSEENGSNSCFAEPEENGFVISAMDLKRRREMQALRRQEARKKREEKLLKKSRGSGFVVDDKKLLLLSSLEAQQVRARAVEREARERDSEERARKKKDKDVGKCVISDLNLSLFSGEDYNDEMIEGQSERLYPQVQQFVAGCGNGTFGCPWPWKGNVGCSSVGGSTSVDYCDDSEQSNGGGMVNGRGNLNAGSNGSLGQCSSAVSDYQSTWRKGGNTGDGGSNSHLEGNGSSSPTQLDTVAPSSISQSIWTRLPQESKTGSCPDQIANSNSPAANNRASLPSKEMNGGEPVDKPPNQNSNAASSVPHMPCVTTTGNGPNGRTLTGFLYKYSKTEVSIMCVCHGSSFSPAEFVEHAGGVDVSNPLKHITVVPSPMAFR